MSTKQYIAVFICFLMNMLDGMDVLIISYAAPAIAKAWNISPANLGIVFSSGLVGMTVGAIFLAPFADRIGRKSTMLIAGLLMATCIYLTSFATDINLLMIFRFISGLGIGAMMATTAALTAENSPTSTRNFWVSTVVAGYPVGAVLSGLVAATVIKTSGWEHLFELAGYATFLSLPLVGLFIKESFALSKQDDTKPSVQILVKEPYRISTFQLWTALFLAFATLYFMLNWIPKLATNAGLSLSAAIYAGTVFNLGAIVGIPMQGYCSSRFGLKKTIGTILIFTALVMLSFGFFVETDYVLVIFFLMGFGVQGGFVGLYAVAASMYPTYIRTTGVGWAIGAGRLGGIIGPILGGLLVAWGLDMTQSFWVFAIPSALAGLMTFRISSKDIS
ncbi:MFS transporter [Aquirufa regiilacus]|uniref:MFS transporter n=1 Tax=Aquirufa regiilacus TaxID=3024868 RepID=A0ABU3TTH0_9BACT|nr:MFS transporter [Aquirufa sp. LEOWEIH-7C]MDU0809163.1 MFS transporter [Aquirufa sp. LEOWEIH-7C]